jgi:hypothetical protein
MLKTKPRMNQQINHKLKIIRKSVNKKKINQLCQAKKEKAIKSIIFLDQMIY